MTVPTGRQIVLDTETTGLSPNDGHRIVEIGAIELINLHPTGNTFHHYINPEREIPEESTRIHGITDDRVAGCPHFLGIVDAFLAFIGDSPLVIHNAPFDMGFINAELSRCGRNPLDEHPVVDTLIEARRRHPRQRNSLDALCRRYGIDNAHRTLHGALLDSEILAEVYVAMLGGHQIVLNGLEERWGGDVRQTEEVVEKSFGGGGLIPEGCQLPMGRTPLLINATADEMEAHQHILERLGDTRIWQDNGDS
ncbi:MAG: DNA polymerase III subunit epsilon [Leptospirillia bacterium]